MKNKLAVMDAHERGFLSRETINALVDRGDEATGIDVLRRLRRIVNEPEIRFRLTYGNRLCERVALLVAEGEAWGELLQALIRDDGRHGA
jgi:hypothetical protein